MEKHFKRSTDYPLMRAIHPFNIIKDTEFHFILGSLGQAGNRSDECEGR